ncbi:hypothetical protein J1N35_035392 [Gossypium stocksii]|uniref:MBD domain-containing protein n=1 Tax=Gossypium stocksii TaxID=47602 RepID=A0A9D3UTV2_9ROSI|nr:hypothetical protein J1N35_035392 [Gossypium stocksii]
MDSAKDDVVCLQLTAPPGWKKMLKPKKGGTPKKNEIIFTAPSGEQISNKKQLDHYLKQHPGGPVISEFDWGTGETPRRSARISEKVKAMPTADSEPPKKRGRKSSASKDDNKESKTAPEGAEDSKDVMEEAGKSEEENENENKDKTQDGNSKSEPTSKEVTRGVDAKIYTNIEEGKGDGEAVSEKLKCPQGGVETNASGFGQKETADMEDATSDGKVEQLASEAEKGLGSMEQEKPNVCITEERKNEGEGEGKPKHDRSTIESEREVKVNEAANRDETEEAIQNGSKGGNAEEVKP